MSNSIVIQTNSTVIEDMKQQYKHSLSPKTPQGGIFMAKVPSCTITAYKSGKVMFQGGRAEAEASRWQTVSQTPKTAVKICRFPSLCASCFHRYNVYCRV